LIDGFFTSFQFEFAERHRLGWNSVSFALLPLARRNRHTRLAEIVTRASADLCAEFRGMSLRMES